LARLDLSRIIRVAVCAVAACGISLAQTTTEQSAPKTTHKTTNKTASTSTPHKKSASSTTHSSTTAHKSTQASAHKASLSHKKRHRRRRPLTAREIAHSRKLQSAFVASAQLRPMAQQLYTLRSPAAYAGVTAYAHSHTGEAASAAYLSLGHAYLLDHKYSEAVAEFQNADRVGTALDDYAAYLTAQAYLQANMQPNAEPILKTFIQKYPDSIFLPQIPVLEANLLIQEGKPQAALAVLDTHKTEPIANKPDFQLALARATQLSGNTAEAQQLYTHVYLSFPLSAEATQARSSPRREPSPRSPPRNAAGAPTRSTPSTATLKPKKSTAPSRRTHPSIPPRATECSSPPHPASGN
jgi:soluble lytic murein transglycosylase